MERQRVFMKKIIPVLLMLLIALPLVSQDILVKKYSRCKFYAGPEIAFPVGRLDELSGMGFGVMTGFTYGYGRFEPGVLSGIYYFNGIEEMTNSLTLVPLLASGGYRFMFRNRFFFQARIAAGGTVVVLRQDPDNVSFFEDAEYETKASFDFMTRGGIGLGYRVVDNCRVLIESDYAAVVEGKNIFRFFTLGVNAVYLF